MKVITTVYIDEDLLRVFKYKNILIYEETRIKPIVKENKEDPGNPIIYGKVIKLFSTWDLKNNIIDCSSLKQVLGYINNQFIFNPLTGVKEILKNY
jgi:hypothetical protein